MRMQRLPEKGETVTNGIYLPTFGGKGANSAVAAARVGGEVEFVGCIGDDNGGSALRAELIHFGVGVQHLKEITGVATGQALVMVGAEGGNYLSVAPGANHEVNPQLIHRLLQELPTNALVLLQNEIPDRVNKAVLATARRRGIACLFNFAPVVPFPIAELEGLAYLLVNEHEADGLLQMQSMPPMAVHDPKGAAQSLRSLGIGCVVITLGARGAVVADKSGIELIPALQVKAVDTTAAGDTFSGTFAVALAEGADPFAAARFAVVAAALSVTKSGAMISCPTREAIEKHHPNLSNP